MGADTTQKDANGFVAALVYTSHRSTRTLPWLMGAVVLAALITMVPPSILLGVCALLVAFVLPLLNPVFGLYEAVLSVPVQEAILLPGGISYTQAAVAWALCAWLLHIWAHPEQRGVFGAGGWRWMVLLWALLLAATVTPYSQQDALKEVGRWLAAFVVWLIAVNTVRQRWQAVGLVACVLAAPAAEALIGLAQFVSGDGPPSFRIAQSLPYVRAYGTIGTPNPFAGYLNMAWPLAVAVAAALTWALLRRHRAERWQAAALAGGAWIVAGALLAALLASFSRGGWVGVVIGVAGLAAALGRRTAYAVLAGIAVCALLVLLGGAGVLPAALASRITSVASSFAVVDPSTVQVTPANFAVVERTAQMWAGVRMFVEHPLTGVGPGNYTLAYPDVAAAPWYVSRGHAHNFYIHVAAESGVLGLSAYLFWLGGMAYAAYAQTQRAPDLFWRSVGIGCCGVIAAVAGHDLFEQLHVLNMGIQFAAIFALVTVMPHQHGAAKLA